MTPPSPWLRFTGAPTMREINVPPFTGAQHASWEALIEIAEDLGDDWALVGGQMVMLHALDSPSVVPRVSRDVDVVMDLRASPKSLARAHTALTAHGFEQQLSMSTGLGHRYKRGDAQFDVMVPDGMGRRATVSIGAGWTVQSPGASRALFRMQRVRVSYGGASAVIGLPSRLGAVVSKAAILYAGSESAGGPAMRHIEDLEVLVPLLELRSDLSLSRSERRLLRAVAGDRRLSSSVRRIAERITQPDAPGGSDGGMRRSSGGD